MHQCEECAAVRKELEEAELYIRDVESDNARLRTLLEDLRRSYEEAYERRFSDA